MSTTPQTPGEGAWFPYYLGVLAGQKLPGMDEVVAGLDVIRLRPGHVLFDIGEPHNYMYLVRKGTMKISTFGRGTASRSSPSADPRTWSRVCSG